MIYPKLSDGTIDWCAMCKHEGSDFYDLCCMCDYGEKEDDPPTRYEPKPQTNADKLRAMSDEEIAEYMASKETALTDLIFLKVQAELKKKGLLIDFSSRFHPDLLKQRDWWLDYLRQEAQP